MSKYNVLIADDEEMIRYGLESLVGEDEDFNVVALAEDGEVALNLAKETMPDLILVDVNMPFMNGLEFVEEIIKVLPDVVVVIVTGYDDFKYVKKALQLGAKDYILKPIMEEPFYEVLGKVKAEIDAIKNSNKYIEWGKNQLERNRPMLIDRFMQEWLNYQLDEVEIRDKMGYLKMEIPENWGMLLINMRIGYDNHIEEALMQFVARNISEELITPDNAPISFVSTSGTIGLISKPLGSEKDSILDSIRENIENILGVKAFMSYVEGKNIFDIPQEFAGQENELIGKKHYSKTVLECLEIINGRFGDSQMSLQFAADEIHVSPQYLSRVFKSETGDTFGQVLSKVRCDAAIAMLKDPEIKIYEISERCGYATQHYFSGAFKKSMGMSPMDYRKKVCANYEQ